MNPEGAGLQIGETYQRNAEWHARDRSGQSRTVSTDLDSEASEADREADHLRAEAEQAEAKKRERRIVVNLNKLGAARTGCEAILSPRCWPALLTALVGAPHRWH